MDNLLTGGSSAYNILNRPASFEVAMGSLLDLVKTMVDYEVSFIYLTNGKKDRLLLKASRGSQETGEVLCKSQVALSQDGVYSWVFQTKEPFLTDDISKDPRFAHLYPGTKVRSLMVIPLIVEEDLIGVLALGSSVPNVFAEKHLKTLSELSLLAASLYKTLESLESLAQLTEDLLENLSFGVIILDRAGKVVALNSAFENIFGASKKILLGKLFSEILEKRPKTAPKELDLALSTLWRRMTKENRTQLDQEISYLGRHKEKKHLHLQCFQLKSKKGKPWGTMVMVIDLTDKRPSEDRIIHSANDLSLVGRLAANLAHEIRNSLSSVKGAAQYLHKEYEDHRLVVEFTQIINQEVHRLNKFTTDFLYFAHPKYLDLRYHNINEILQEVIQMVSQEASSQGIEVIKKFDPGLPLAKVDHEQLKQAFLNLALNALQAMPKGGRLEIRTAFRRSKTKSRVKVQIVDTGVGIPEDQLNRIFIPFFTTKAKGSGLGLSIVRQIVESHRGNIKVQSQVGRGTTFSIYLPISAEAEGQLDLLKEETELAKK